MRTTLADARALDRARPRFDRPHPHRRDAHALARRGRRRSGRSPPPTRSPARSTLPAPSYVAYVVHAEGPHPVAPRRDAPGAAARARHPPLVGDRARRADARGRSALDAAVYDRVLSYQPAWLAVPLGALELADRLPAMRYAALPRRCGLRLLLYALGWVTAQVFAHGLLPRLRLEYAEAGGELGRAGALTAAAVAVVVGRRPRRGVRGSTADRSPARHRAGTARDPPRGDARRRRRAAEVSSSARTT